MSAYGVPEHHVEALCEVMHDAYEAEAQRAGWATNLDSRRAWPDVPEPNKRAMRAGVRAMIAALFRPADAPRPGTATKPDPSASGGAS